MNSKAHVTSLQVIADFRSELRRFEQAVRQILEEQYTEVQRANDYVEHDRTVYWPRTLKQAEQSVVRAREALSRAKMSAMQNEHKSCVDEKEALERAVARQRHCEHQLRRLPHWRNLLRKHTEDYRTRRARLIHYLDVDIPRAIAALERILAALEKYAELPPESLAPTIPPNNSSPAP